MKRIKLFSALLGTVLLFPLSANAQAPGYGAPVQAQGYGVRVNGQPLSPQAIAHLGSIPPGQYWYDNQSGAYGMWGGPTQGFLQPGLSMPAKLPAHASNGNTGVFINGRNLPQQDLQALSQLAGHPIKPGRYTVTGQGSFGPEGGAPTANLKQRAAAAGGQRGQTVQKNNNATSGPQSFAGWNMQYTVPSSRNVAYNKQGLQVLRSDTSQSLILVQRALLRSEKELNRQLHKLAQMNQLQLTAKEPVQVTQSGNNQIVRGVFSAQSAYGQYTLRLAAVLSGQGTGLVVLGGSPPNEFPALRKEVDTLTSSAKVGVPQYNNGVVRGQFSTYSGNSSGSYDDGARWSSETFYRFDGAGRYSTNNNSMVNVTTKGTSDSDAPDYIDSEGYEVRFGGSSAGDISETSDAGTYAVIGDMLMINTASGTSYHNFEIIGYTMDGVYTSNGIKLDGELYPRN